MIKRVILLFVGVISIITGYAQGYPQGALTSINQGALRGPLSFLASDWTEGREMGTRGAYMASDYIASMMEVYGLKPYFGDGYFQPFGVVQYIDSGNHMLKVTRVSKQGSSSYTFEHRREFSVVSGSRSININTSLAFVGYGLVDKQAGYNDYKGVDVQGKWVMMLDGYPGHDAADPEADGLFRPRNKQALYAMEQRKLDEAKARGAVGVIHIDRAMTCLEWADNVPFRQEHKTMEFDGKVKTYQDKHFELPGSTIDESIVEVYITSQVASLILGDAQKRVDEWEKRCAQKPRGGAFDVKALQVDLQTSVEKKILQARNVAGWIPGKDTTRWVIVGAHYDHYGHYNGYIWNGADDNASGTVGMLSLARAFETMEAQPECNMLFIAFTGEEKGLLGSRAFVRTMKEDMQVDFMLNLDMIGRDARRDSLHNQCAIIYTMGAEDMKADYLSIVEQQQLNLDLIFYPSDGQRASSDHAYFARRGIRYAFFWTGWHDDYHEPGDEVSKVNFGKMERLCHLAFMHMYDEMKK